MQRHQPYARGFTLIETIVYIALLGFLMTGTLLAVYGIIQSGASGADMTNVESEGNFIIRKIAWALGDAETALTPSSTLLSVTLHDGTDVDFRLSDEVIQMRRDGGTWIDLSSENVIVSAASFETISGSPSGILATLTMNGEVFTTRRYLRE